MTELCALMKEFGSDKYGDKHNFSLFYYELFNQIKNKELNVFELGLGTNNLDVPSNMGINGKPGASLRAWKKFFPNSYIFGGDIDTRILFEEDKIKTFFCDQTKKQSVLELWNQPSIKDVFFDIIIEDGLHNFDANLIFLENSLFKVKKGGFYICEDLIDETIIRFEKILPNLSNHFSDCSFEIKKLNHPKNNLDNNLLVVKKI